MFVASILSRILIMLMAVIMFSSSAQAGILGKLNPFSSGNSKIDVNKIKKERAKKIKKLQQKVDRDPRAMAILANYYQNGLRMPRDRKKSLELYKKAFAAGDAVARLRMGEYYSFGLDIDNDGIFEIPVDREKGDAMRAQSVKGLAKLAGKKDGEALYILGMFYKWGVFGLEKSQKKFRKYMEKSAKQGSAKGMHQFGEILLTEGGKKHREACDYFAKSAILGYHRGISAIAYCYETGRGRLRDTAVAQRWYDYGSKHYSVDSMIHMGDVYINKSGDENKEKAAEYYDMAIAEGSARGYEGYARAAHDEKKAYHYQQALAHDLGNANYLKEVQNYREKDTNGTEKIIGLEPKQYSREDILSLAQKAAAGNDGAKEMIKDFMLMGYVKSLEPVTLLTLDNGFNDEYGTALFFSPDNRTLTITRTFGMSIYRQTVNSTWDVATKTLLSITVLDPGYEVLAVSDDGKKFAMEVRVTKYWEHPFTGDAILTLNESETGKILFKLKDLDRDDVYGFSTYFTGDDKFLNVYYDVYLPAKEKSQDRGSLYNVITGKNVTDDRGYVRRKVSPNGLHVLTSARPNDGDDYPEKALKHQRLPDWVGGKKLDDLIRLEFDEGVFSPDSRYWITPGYIYDLKEDKDLGKHDAAHNTSVPFKHIPGTSLLIRVYNNSINTYLMEGSSIMKVASMPMDVKWSKFELDHIFSPDFTKITINGVREGSANKETYIQPYKKPTADKIAKEKKNQQEELNKKKQMAAVMEMFEVGFDDQAMEQMKVIIDNDPTSTGPAFQMLEKRGEISATAVGQVMKTAIDATLAATDIMKIGVTLEDKKNDLGTGDAIVEAIMLYDSNVRKAGVRVGDKIISLDGIPYSRPKSAEMKDHINSIKANQQVTMIVARDGQQISITYKAQEIPDGWGLKMGMHQLFWYGLIANAAGHPDIAEMAVQHIEEQLARKIFTLGESIWGDETRQSIAMLKAVVLANRGDLKQAYNILLAEKSMKANDKWGVNHFGWYPDLFVDLFKEPKKLAYILGKKVEDLPKFEGIKVKSADFWTLDGRLIKVGETAIIKEEGGFVID